MTRARLNRFIYFPFFFMKNRAFLVAASLLTLAACAPTTPSDPNMVDDITTQDEVTLEWQFVATEATSDTDTPEVSAALVVSGAQSKTIDLGTYTGSEFTVPGNVSDLSTTPLTSASVWYIGGGDDLIVNRLPTGDIIISHRTVDEEGGYSALTELSRISLSADAAVTILK
jgi:primosomal replication protein N